MSHVLKKRCVASKRVMKRTNKKETNWKTSLKADDGRSDWPWYLIQLHNLSGCAFIVRINESVVNIEASKRKMVKETDRLSHTRWWYTSCNLWYDALQFFWFQKSRALEWHAFPSLVIFTVSYESYRFLIVDFWECAYIMRYNLCISFLILIEK